MPHGFPVLTDNHVQQPVVDGLVKNGWDVLRSIDVLPAGTNDEVLLEHAAEAGRVFVSNDEDLLAIGHRWLKDGRLFPGIVYWHIDDYKAMTTGDILRALEALAAKKVPFASPIQFVTPPGTRAQRRDRFKRQRPRSRRK